MSTPDLTPIHLWKFSIVYKRLYSFLRLSRIENSLRVDDHSYLSLFDAWIRQWIGIDSGNSENMPLIALSQILEISYKLNRLSTIIINLTRSTPTSAGLDIGHANGRSLCRPCSFIFAYPLHVEIQFCYSLAITWIIKNGFLQLLCKSQVRIFQHLWKGLDFRKKRPNLKILKLYN